MTNAFNQKNFFHLINNFEMPLLNILILMKNTKYKMFNMLPKKYVEVNCSN